VANGARAFSQEDIRLEHLESKQQVLELEADLNNLKQRLPVPEPNPELTLS